MIIRATEKPVETHLVFEIEILPNDRMGIGESLVDQARFGDNQIVRLQALLQLALIDRDGVTDAQKSPEWPRKEAA